MASDQPCPTNKIKKAKLEEMINDDHWKTLEWIWIHIWIDKAEKKGSMTLVQNGKALYTTK